MMRREKKSCSGVFEVPAVLHKERALFRIDDLEALVDGYLGLIRFYLAEIGIEGDIERESIPQYCLGVQPGASLGLGLISGHAGRLGIEKARAREQSIGDQLDI